LKIIHAPSYLKVFVFVFFFSSRRRHTRWPRDWSSDVCSSDLAPPPVLRTRARMTPAIVPTISVAPRGSPAASPGVTRTYLNARRSEEHTSELQSRGHLVCRLLLEKKKKHYYYYFKFNYHNSQL